MRIPQRAQVVIDLIKENDFKRVVEIGVCKGEMAMPIMTECDLDYYGIIDPALNNALGIYDFISKHPEVDLYEMTSLEASEDFEDSELDLVIIDALHIEKEVDQDTHLWTPKVRHGGIVCGHDYDNKRFPGVKIAVDRFYNEARIETKPVRACKMWVFKKISASW